MTFFYIFMELLNFTPFIKISVKVITHKIEALKIFICHMSRYTAVKCYLFGLIVNDKEWRKYEERVEKVASKIYILQNKVK